MQPDGVQTAFASLGNRDFRLYFASQVGSNIGAWIQITAENWLVLQLTDSGLALGITNALQFGPILLFGLHGGVIADRSDRRRLLILTQSALAVLAAAVGLLVATGLIRLWMIWLLALTSGLIMAIDKPALHAILKDLVGERDLPNAVALNNAAISSGRMVGPAISGLLIAAFGLAPGFFINAATFAAVVLALARLRAAHPGHIAERRPGQALETLRTIRRSPVLTLTVIAMSVIFLSVYNFQVLVPLLTTRVLGGSSALYGLVMSCVGLGAVNGSLLIAAVKPGVRAIVLWCGLLSVVHFWLALPLGAVSAFAGLYLLGLVCGLFSVTVAGTLQRHARDDMRGRVMALYSIAILGSSLVGSPAVGMLADTIGVRNTLLIIAAVCAGTACATALAWRTGKRGRP